MGKEALKTILARTNILFITETEFRLLFGEVAYDSPLEMLYNLDAPPPFTPAIVIKQGKKGASCLTGDGIFASAAPSDHIEVIDNTGAGDAFNAGFIHAYLEGKDLQQCLKEGNRLAGLSLTKWGRGWMRRIEQDV